MQLLKLYIYIFFPPSLLCFTDANTDTWQLLSEYKTPVEIWDELQFDNSCGKFTPDFYFWHFFAQITNQIYGCLPFRLLSAHSAGCELPDKP